ncbi:unnamed protein product [Rotaria sp. Silwood1]|nr:unnamed protein product [Rotaria sp. Silwood1]
MITSFMTSQSTSESQTVTVTESSTSQIYSTEVVTGIETMSIGTSEIPTESSTEPETVTISEGPASQTSSTATSPVTETETMITSLMTSQSTSESQTVSVTETSTSQIPSAEPVATTETETMVTSESATESTTESQTITATEGSSGQASSTETIVGTETTAGTTLEAVTGSTTEFQTATVTQVSTVAVSSSEAATGTEAESMGTSEAVSESTSVSQTATMTEASTRQLYSLETVQEQSTTSAETEAFSLTETSTTVSLFPSSTATSLVTETVPSASESTTEMLSIETTSVSAANTSQITTQVPTEMETTATSIETTTISETEFNATSTTTTEGTETMSMSESQSTITTETSTVISSSVVTQPSVETSQIITESSTTTVAVVTESIPPIETTETSGIYTVSESENTSSSLTSSTMSTTETSSSTTLSNELSTETMSTSESSSSSSITSTSESSTQALESTEGTGFSTVTQSEISSSATTTETGTTSQSSSTSTSVGINNETSFTAQIETSTSTESTVTTSSTETTTQSFQNGTLFFLYFNYMTGRSRMRRQIFIGSPPSSTIENEVALILSGMNITCNDTCIQVSQTSVALPDVEYSVTLNVFLDIPQRIELVNGFFTNNVSLNDSYRLTVRIIMNSATTDFLNFTTVTPACKECEYAFTGNCTGDNTGCVCYPNYAGQYCRNFVQSTTIYLPTSITPLTLSSISSTTTISTVQTSESLTQISITLTESTVTESQLSTNYSTFAPVTIVSETSGTGTSSIVTTSLLTENVQSSQGTSESMTSATFSSTSSTVTNTLFSSTIAQSITQGQTTEATTTISTATAEIGSSTVSITMSITAATGTYGNTTLTMTTATTSTRITSATAITTAMETVESTTSTQTPSTLSSISTPLASSTAQTQTGQTTITFSSSTATTTRSSAQTGTVEVTTAGTGTTISTSAPTTLSTAQTQTGQTTTTIGSSTVTATRSSAQTGTVEVTTVGTGTIISTSAPTTLLTAQTQTGQTTTTIGSSTVTATRSSAQTGTIGVTTAGTGTTISTFVPTTLSTAQTSTQTGQSSTTISSSTASTARSSVQTGTVELTTVGTGTTASTTTSMTVPTTATVTVVVPTLTISGGTTSLSSAATNVTATGITSSITNTDTFITISTTLTTNTTQMTTVTSILMSTTISTTTTASPQTCGWGNWVIISPCSATCGEAYRLVNRSCVSLITGQTCDTSACGSGSAMQNESCPGSPPCETITVTPAPSIRDPTLQISSYVLPDAMYFFEQSYDRIWITNKGYISFGSPFYSQTMTRFIFGQLYNQAIAAPFWADLAYDNTNSAITVNWYSSMSANQTDANTYNAIIQAAVSEACPTQSCSSDFAAVRVVRISWQNLYYTSPGNSAPISLSFSAYLINTYDVGSYSYPILRSYLSFDYTNLTRNLGYLKPFVGYRGKYSIVQTFNDPFFYQNALFLTQASRRNFYIGGRFLTQCEVSSLQETNLINLYPSENLNDEVNNPRFPCPCSLGQAIADRRFSRLNSETNYERLKRLACFGPLITVWIPVGFNFKALRAQTCCYSEINGGLITYGDLAGSVLSNPFILFQQYSWLKRIAFHDQCCSSTNFGGTANWNICRLYYQIHPPSSCTGYQPPTMVTGIGDPHINTIDNGRYTCHIQGIYVFAQTNDNAIATAQYNRNNTSTSGSNLIYPDDLFQIYVRSVSIPPALSYIERTQGDASIFSSYAIVAGSYTFNISNNDGKFGFVANNGSSILSLTDNLASNLNYDNGDLINYNDRYIYRVQQTVVTIGNITVPQLTFALWSGLSMECRIVSENLDCILSLPQKYQTFIEGLIGNFNGDYSDDLINRQTSQTILISPADSATSMNNDTEVLRACLSWKVPSDTTPIMTNPIMPSYLVYTYYNESADTLASLNPRLSQSMIDQTCSTNFECRHDYIIRINPITSAATASSLNSFQQSRTILAETVPTINISSAIQIGIPYNDTNRIYTLPITITGAKSTLVNISQNGTMSTTSFNNVSIMIPIPNDATSYVQAFLTMNYGTNSTLIQYLDIIACLCRNTSYCNYDDTTTIYDNYELAACRCPDQYDGVFCQDSYNGCNAGSACKIYWNNDTTCSPLSADDQVRLNRSYTCNGTCSSGFNSTNNYTCDDINECQQNSTLCGNGVCINLIGSYTCNCSTGYRFENKTCVDINECREPNVDGTFGARCNTTDVCINTIGNYTCQCSPIFNTNGTCVFDSSKCSGDTCRGANGTILCLRGTIDINNSCVPWCNSTCPGFCEKMNDVYQCNCGKSPGLRHSEDGKQCLECYNLNYGYGCNQTCNCTYGTCNSNATSTNGSCKCDSGYEGTFCDKRIDKCASSNPCNSVLEDCVTDPANQTATCSCKSGYQRNTTSSNCTDINECESQLDLCIRDVSSCFNTNGSYSCVCLSGYQPLNGSCIDINDCNANQTICSGYSNTYCTNTQGSYECRCSSNYSLGGNYYQQFGNARNSTSSCLPTNYSIFCENQCLKPATCSEITGRCQCPANYSLASYSLNNTLQTCLCPGHPYVYFNGTECIAINAPTVFTVTFNLTSSGRFILISPLNSSNIENNTSSFLLSNMNIQCNGSCIQIYDTQTVALPARQLVIALSVFLNITQRILFARYLFNTPNLLNASYSTIFVQAIMDTNTNVTVNISKAPELCEECVYLGIGLCLPNGTDCLCTGNYGGYFCRNLTTTTTAVLTQTLSDRNWTIIIACVSAVAGLFLIVSIVMCVFFCIKQRNTPATGIKSLPNRQQFTIPRAHFPTVGTISPNLLDDFSLDNTNDESYVDASDSLPSSSNTTYNTTYRANGNRPEADFGIFDELENRIPLSKGQIPRPQMLDMMGTLNSLPAQERFDGPSGAASTFSDSRDLDDIEFVTDMVDDMTKDDDMEDEFVEALNPNLAMPRSALRPEMKSSGWFPFFRNS